MKKIEEKDSFGDANSSLSWLDGSTPAQILENNVNNFETVEFIKNKKS